MAALLEASRYGAVPGATGLPGKIQAALDAVGARGGTLVFRPGLYALAGATGPLRVRPGHGNARILAYGAVFDGTGMAAGSDILHIGGGRHAAAENIVVEGLEARHAPRHGIHVQGGRDRSQGGGQAGIWAGRQPRGITLLATRTTASGQGGIVVSGARGLRILRHTERDSRYGVAAMAQGGQHRGEQHRVLPGSPAAPHDLEDVLIEGCDLAGNTGGGLRVSDGRDVRIVDNRIDATRLLPCPGLAAGGTGIAIERTEGFLLHGNAVLGVEASGSQVPLSCILATGAVDGIITGNITIGGRFGIQGYFNGEGGGGRPRPERLVMADNIALGATAHGILLHGPRDAGPVPLATALADPRGPAGALLVDGLCEGVAPQGGGALLVGDNVPVRASGGLRRDAAPPRPRRPPDHAPDHAPHLGAFTQALGTPVSGYVWVKDQAVH